MSRYNSVVRESVETDRGATMVEYALIVTAIALVVVVSAQTFGLAVLALFDDMTSAF